MYIGAIFNAKKSYKVHKLKISQSNEEVEVTDGFYLEFDVKFYFKFILEST